jgi:hypothetical protein
VPRKPRTMTSTQEQAQEAAAAAKDKAGEAAQQARGRVREQLDQRSTQAGERVTSQASDVRTVASTLREQGQDKPAQLAEQAADKVEQLGGYLTSADADKLLHDLEDMARRQPMAVAFGGLALGFMASRFLKASSAQRYQATQGGYTPPARPALPPATPRPVGVGTTPGTTPAAPLGGTGTGVGVGTGTGFPDPVVGTERTAPITPSPAGGF